MNCLQLKGKYTISKKDENIIVDNKLTIFGALQLARLFKKDVTFPKNNSNYFGRIVSYNGQLKKIRIKEGSDVSFSNINSNAISIDNNEQTMNHIIDGSLTSSTLMKITKSGNATGSFDIVLKDAVNLKRIGILAHYLPNSNEQFNQNNFNNISYIPDLSFGVKIDGFNLKYTKKQGGTSTELSKENDQYQFLQGDYVRVYNPYKPTINERPYYLNKQKDSKLKDHIYCLHFYWYDEQKKYCWAISQAIFTELSNDNLKTPANKYCVDIPSQQPKIILNGITSLSETNSFDSTKTVVQDDTSVQYKYNFVINKGTETWLQPVNRLYNYLVDYFDTNGVKLTQKRYMSLLSDMSNMNYLIYNNYTKKINYNAYSNSFDNMLSYSIVSFENLSNFQQLYNVKKDENDVYIKTIQSSDQNITGFIPYVTALRFTSTNLRRQSQYYGYDNKLRIYSIDLFQQLKTPYIPCKIALSTSQDAWEQANSWFVDSIQLKGDNTVVFTKQLQANQGVTQNGFVKIGLFGNFNGYLDGTLPNQIKIIKQNCFSQAKFVNSWTKTNQQQIIVTYQLIIGA